MTSPLAADHAPGLPDRMPMLEPILGELPAALARALTGARRSGSLDPEQLRLPLRPVVARVLSEPDTLSRALAHAPPSALLYRRSLNCAVLLGRFGRQLGFSRPWIEDLMLGGLLLDVGKLAVPVPILAKHGTLTPIERGYVYRHVKRGLTITGVDRTEDSTLYQMLAGHHERMDGSGYPRRLRGTRIPLAARIAAIVDSFDAMTLDRGYARGLPADQALRELIRMRGTRFDAALLLQFVRAVGWFPTGTWLELRDGRIGVVHEQTPGRSLQPLIRIVRGPTGQACEEPYRYWQPRTRHEIVRCLRADDPQVQQLRASAVALPQFAR